MKKQVKNIFFERSENWKKGQLASSRLYVRLSAPKVG